MKPLINIFTLTILTLLLGCGSPTRQDQEVQAVNDSLQNNGIKKELTQEERSKQTAERNRLDSLRLDLALKDAFNIAKPAFTMENFTKQYEFQPGDSSYAIHVDILIGKLFSDDRKYFLLRRHVPWATYLDLYKITNDKTEKLITREQGGMTYMGDTIFDVNGDGHKDFLVHWYPSSGCCKRDIYNVYLSLPDKEKFTNDYEFMNPTFSAKEGIIRGIEYGHPGEVGLYKYKWNALQVDTIEFIYPDVHHQGQFIKTQKRAYKPTGREGAVLKAVPEEYLNIESYTWFADF
jgi:hypothetical protein